MTEALVPEIREGMIEWAKRRDPDKVKLLEESDDAVIEYFEDFIKRGGGFHMARDKGPKRPTRDEYALEELGERLVEAQQEEATVQLEVWYQRYVVGRIVKMDSRTKMIHVLQKNGESERVPFMDIMRVDNAS